VTVAPEPCLIIMFCDPEVAFSMSHSFETVFGPIVIVQAESKVPVYLRKRLRPASVEPSAIVVVCVSANDYTLSAACAILYEPQLAYGIRANSDRTGRV